MRVWFALIGLISLVVVGSRAFAGNPPEQPALPAAPAKAAVPHPAKTRTAKRVKPLAAPRGQIAVRGEGAIYLVDPDSGAARKVVENTDMSQPDWSPDAKLLAVERTEKAESSIWTIRPDGTGLQLVLRNASSPSWSPEGDRIIAVRGECATPCEPEDDSANVLFSVRPDGSDPQRVDFEDADAYVGRDLAWPTDGNSIGFFADESSSNPGSFDSSAAAWSPDGTRLAFVGAIGPTDEENATAPGQTGLWVVSADGGTPQLLLKGASGRPSWSS